MRILVSGAGGLVGRGLLPVLAADGHQVRRLVRAPPRAAGEFSWDPRARSLDPAALADCDAVVHLAGARVVASAVVGRQGR